MVSLSNARRTRFPEVDFGDAAWHILLDLYLEEEAGRKVSISSACIGSGAAATTALRHLGRLVETGVVIREGDPHDRRRAFVRLAPAARARLTTVLLSAVE